MRASACLLALCVTSVSALVHRYTPYKDYFTDNSRSEYYGKVKDILYPVDVSHDEPRMRIIDGMLYDYVDIVSTQPMYKDCVPFVSQYSDCSIENICLGCTVCLCDMVGRWNCSQGQKCRPDPQLEVDHLILVTAMDNLLEEDKALGARRKRSSDFEGNLKSYEDLSKWMYGISPFDFEDIINQTKYIKMDETTNHTNENESQIFNFEQFLIDVGYYFHMHKQGNDTLKEKISKTATGNTQESDLTDYKDFFTLLENLTESTDTIPSVLHNTFCIVPPIEDSHKTELPINTYELISDYLKKQSDLLTHFMMPHNITKREVSNIGSNNTKNITIFIKNITENSFYPLESIIKEKQEELSELTNIRDNLLDSINAYVGFEVSNITNTSKIQNADLRFIVYEVDKKDDENLSNILRIDNRSLLEKYQIKLKTDIGEVIKDIAVIQRLPKSSNIAHDLRFLIRALKHYLKNMPGKYVEKRNERNITDNNFRRRYNSDKERITNSVLLLSNILEVLDKGSPQVNVLSLMSKKAMKLIKRIINQLYTDELSGVHSKLNDEEYNLANNLEEIGSNWQKRMTDINNCIPAERLYKMKLFHLELSADIDILKDVLILRGFAERRRMSLIKDSKSEKKVMENLIKIHSDIRRITEMANEPKRNIPGPKRRKSKHGFLQKVKRLLKKSKQGIRGILKKNKATPDMIKKIAKKRLHDMTKKKLSKYEDTMYRWQDNLNIVPRIKRSANEFQNFMNRVKHIIPGYLHRKVKPAVDSKKRNKNVNRNVTRRVKKHRNHKRSTTTVKTNQKNQAKHH